MAIGGKDIVSPLSDIPPVCHAQWFQPFFAPIILLTVSEYHLTNTVCHVHRLFYALCCIKHQYIADIFAHFTITPGKMLNDQYSNSLPIYGPNAFRNPENFPVIKWLRTAESSETSDIASSLFSAGNVWPHTALPL